MPSFARLFMLAAIAVVASAHVGIRNVASQARCDNPTVKSTNTVEIGGAVITLTTSSCSSNSGAAKRQDPPPTNICGLGCGTESCNHDAGPLPPIVDDCEQIKDAIIIMEPNQSPNFVVNAGDILTLTFGTCSLFVDNIGTNSIEYCWTDFANVASKAGTACFPPVSATDLFSEGTCIAKDFTWNVGAAHS